MVKTFFSELFARVIKSYKSTLVGLGAGVLLMAIDQFVLMADGTDKPWLKILAGLAVVAGAGLKSKALAP